MKACETMVDYCPVRILPLAWESPERCNLCGLLGNVQRGTQCGSENSLISYGIIRWQKSARLQSVLTPYIFSPRLFDGCIIRGADRILPLLRNRLCRPGLGLTAQVVVQVLILTIVYGLVGKAFPEPCLQMLTG
jgi:hypothetical protein